MDLNEGEDWRSLMRDGVISLALLRTLWLGEHKHWDFLARLMQKLGLFAQLPSKDKYMIPCSMSAVTMCGYEEDSDFPVEEIQTHFKPRPVKEIQTHLKPDKAVFPVGEVEPDKPDLANWEHDRPRLFFKYGFLPNGFFERVVVNLVESFPSERAPPYLGQYKIYITPI